MDRRTVSVSGMMCTGCEQNVETALGEMGGVSEVEADHETDSVAVVAGDDMTDEDIATAIEDAGYEPTA